MKTNARIALTKFMDIFTGDDGKEVRFQYVEVEFAPNCFCRFKLNNSNMRVLQKYSPNMYQLLSNIPMGTPVIFEELGGLDEDMQNELQQTYKEYNNPSGIGDIYKNQENEL